MLEILSKKFESPAHEAQERMRFLARKADGGLKAKLRAARMALGLPDLTDSLQRQSKRATNQPHAEDDDFLELGRMTHGLQNHYPSAISSASRKRWFSASVPMVTRNQSGRP